MHLVIYTQTSSVTNYSQRLFPTQKGGCSSPLRQPPQTLISPPGTSLTGSTDTRIPSSIIQNLRDYETLWV